MTAEVRRPITANRLRDMHAAGEPIAMLTCYDATFARLLDGAGVDCLLVGDSLGMVLQGQPSTLQVTLADMAYHTATVARANRTAWVVGDLPFGSYHESPAQAMRSAAALMEAGAHMVKLEGGGWTSETVRFLVERGVPVCGHLGLTPQSVHALGGYRVQGRGDAGAVLQQHAVELAQAGATMLVLELVPAPLAREVTAAVPMPTIGIGAGAGCSGQVLVLHDMLGLPNSHGKQPRFVRDFMQGAGSIDAAVRRYVADVKARAYPDDAVHSHALIHHPSRMKIVHTIAELRTAVGAPQASALVPTMGNLHDGHLDLVRMARGHGLPVVASIFVNRLQFAPNEDFDRYPRTLARDAELLHAAGCDIVFAPDERELYPEPQAFRVVPDPAVADILEGAFRPASSPAWPPS